MAQAIERTVVTGASGFLGAAVSARLAAEGTPVTGISRRAADPGHVAADVRDQDQVRRVLTEVRPSHVFHLAGDRPSRVRTADELPASLQLNAIGAVNVISVAAELGCRMVVVVGSAEEYGGAPVPYREDARELPSSVYGVSKLAATRAALAAGAVSGCPVVVARPTVGYGPGQPADMFLAALLRALLAGEAFPMTSGEQTRDFVFVDDVVEGLVRLASCPAAAGRAWNLGSGVSLPVREVAEKAQRVAGARGLLQFGAIAARPGEPARYAVDMSATRDLLGWHAQVDLEEGLIRTVAAMRP